MAEPQPPRGERTRTTPATGDERAQVIPLLATLQSASQHPLLLCARQPTVSRTQGYDP